MYAHSLRRAILLRKAGKVELSRESRHLSARRVSNMIVEKRVQTWPDRMPLPRINSNGNYSAEFRVLSDFQSDADHIFPCNALF